MVLGMRSLRLFKIMFKGSSFESSMELWKFIHAISLKEITWLFFELTLILWQIDILIVCIFLFRCFVRAFCELEYWKSLYDKLKELKEKLKI